MKTREGMVIIGRVNDADLPRARCPLLFRIRRDGSGYVDVFGRAIDGVLVSASYPRGDRWSRAACVDCIELAIVEYERGRGPVPRQGPVRRI